jgi:hypothetical protein
MAARARAAARRAPRAPPSLNRSRVAVGEIGQVRRARPSEPSRPPRDRDPLRLQHQGEARGRGRSCGQRTRRRASCLPRGKPSRFTLTTSGRRERLARTPRRSRAGGGSASRARSGRAPPRPSLAAPAASVARAAERRRPPALRAPSLPPWTSRGSQASRAQSVRKRPQPAIAVSHPLARAARGTR